MQGQGVGRVMEVNLSLETLRIDFEKRSGVTLGLRAAAKMLKPLPPGHILRRRLEEPEALERLRDESPSELLRAVLETGDKPMTGAEIRDTLSGIVPEAKWPTWWATARKHPQVVASSSGRQTYRWEVSQAGALAAVRKAFGRAEPRTRVELLRKNAERDPALAREMAGDLASLAAERAASEPGLAFEIWFALERSGLLPAALADLPDRLTASGTDLRRLFAGIEDRLLRERALAMTRDRRSDWVSVYRDHATREEDPRVLDLVFEGLRGAEPATADRLVDDLLAQPRRAPAAFVWLAERAADDEALRARAPLRLLQQVLAALAEPRVHALPSPAAGALRHPGGTVPRLLAHLDDEQAAPAADSLRRAAGLEAYAKEPLVAALEMRFPALREDGVAGTGPLYATASAIEAKRAELKRLAEVEIPANRKAIDEARAHGDLRENFEYKSARERHEYLNSRLATLHRELGRARADRFRGPRHQRSARRHARATRRLRRRPASARGPRSLGEQPRTGRALLRIRPGAGACSASSRATASRSPASVCASRRSSPLSRAGRSPRSLPVLLREVSQDPVHRRVRDLLAEGARLQQLPVRLVGEIADFEQQLRRHRVVAQHRRHPGAAPADRSGRAPAGKDAPRARARGTPRSGPPPDRGRGRRSSGAPRARN